MLMAGNITSNQGSALLVAATVGLVAVGMARPPLFPDRGWRFVCWAGATFVASWGSARAQWLPGSPFWEIVAVVAILILALAFLLERALEKAKRPVVHGAVGGRDLADEMEKVLLIKGAILDGRDVLMRAAESNYTSELVDLTNWDAHHHTLSRIPGAKDAYDRSREVVARFKRYNDSDSAIASEDKETVKFAGRAARELNGLYGELTKQSSVEPVRIHRA